MRGKSEFAASPSALRQFDLDATSDIQEVKALGEWAYVWTKLSVVVTPKTGGAPVKRAGNTLLILTAGIIIAAGCCLAVESLH